MNPVIHFYETQTCVFDHQSFSLARGLVLLGSVKLICKQLKQRHLTFRYACSLAQGTHTIIIKQLATTLVLHLCMEYTGTHQTSIASQGHL